MRKLRLLSILLAIVAAMAMKAQDRVAVVKKGDANSLLEAIQTANQQNADTASERFFILIPDGLYDLGEKVLTTISGHNISLVGQSMGGTIIRNAPPKEKEGISKTATIQNRSTGLYLQDLTLQNALDYYSANAAGRAVTLHDKGTRTICNRVRMLSYQDTYYTDREDGLSYLYNTEIHGTVDFICGAGDAYFDHCTLVTEPRNLEGTGRNVIAAPRTSQTQWGYIFDNCLVYNRTSPFQYARGWHTSPRCVWLHTTLMSPEKLVEPRFDPRGMRTVQSYFKEFHTMDASGKDITPKSNVVTFTLKEEKNTVETILTGKEAKCYQPKKIFTDWRPEKIMRKLACKAEQLKKQYL